MNKKSKNKIKILFFIFLYCIINLFFIYNVSVLGVLEGERKNKKILSNLSPIKDVLKENDRIWDSRFFVFLY
jgi:hypothetical protein